MPNIANATRMELTRLKNQLATTRKGHRLLKDKQDEMMRQFLSMIENYKVLRQLVESKWLKALDTYDYAKAYHYEAELKEKFLVPATSLELKYSKSTVMTVAVPEIQVSQKVDPKITYSFHGTNPVLDEVVVTLASNLNDLIALAAMDKRIRILIREIEKTKRRVNAIEHILIPEIIDDIKVVRMKINEAELSNTIRIMKSKDLILKKLTKND
ncbi:V-type ATP synthase subunit D [Acholeplasma granularum]|uniref:V-type ATP synthase subunit D n=1 Tax=Acholeplasma granularum TaxID=264635 RepID=UPI0004AE18CC|nr:V-type ATP synthase subunit D [Acholeplasma granularum]